MEIWMISGRLAVVVSALLLPVLVAFPATPAAGDGQVTAIAFTDDRRDTWRTEYRPRVGWTDPVKSATHRNGDVTRAQVAHRRYAVTVRIEFETLRRKGRHNFWFEYATDRYYEGGGSEGYGQALLSARHGNWDGQLTVRDYLRDETICRGRATHRIDFAADVVTMRVPRACLDGPRYLRLSVGNAWSTTPDSDGGYVEFVDNPHTDRYLGNYTRRLFRG